MNAYVRPHPDGFKAYLGKKSKNRSLHCSAWLDNI